MVGAVVAREVVNILIRRGPPASTAGRNTAKATSSPTMHLPASDSSGKLRPRCFGEGEVHDLLVPFDL